MSDLPPSNSSNIVGDDEVLIETANTRRVGLVAKLMTSPARKFPTMAVVTAHAGEGKTSAIKLLTAHQKCNSYSGLPDILVISVDNKSTARNLAHQIVRALDERPRGRNANEITHEAALILQRNSVRLLIVDEADALNDEGFEVLRYLHDQTGCGIILVGIPHVLALIDRQEKFSSRVTIRMSFRPIEMEEMLKDILPFLRFSRWRFDPNNEDDQKLGSYIWSAVRPSFRRLTHWMQHAEILAASKEPPQMIDREVLEKARQFHQGGNQSARGGQSYSKSKPGSPEDESERRHNGKKK